MFKRKTLADYEEAIVQGRMFLIRNRLLEKHSEWRSDGFSSDDTYKAYILTFHGTHPHIVDNYQRYEYVSRSAYNECTVGDQYYLVLMPEKKNDTNVKVTAIFPCETTMLTPALTSALERDSSRTGFPVSLAQEQQERKARYDELIKKIEENRYKDETPEEKEKRMKKEKDQQIFGEITNKILKPLGYFFLMPLIILGFILLFFAPLWGMVCILGGPFLFLFIVLLLLALKKPLIAMKKRRLDINE